jgi:hypothetical protein
MSASHERYRQYGKEFVDRINSTGNTNLTLEKIPLYILAAQARADRINAQKIPGSPDLAFLDVLEEDKRRVLASTYPGLDCLRVQDFLEIGASGKVSQEVLDHLNSCQGCQSYLPININLEELEVQRPEPHNSWPIETIPENQPHMLILAAFVGLAMLLILAIALPFLFSWACCRIPLNNSYFSDFSSSKETPKMI